MRLDDGRELIATLALPLDVDVFAAIGESLGITLRRLGFREVTVQATDDPMAPHVIAARPSFGAAVWASLTREDER